MQESILTRLQSVQSDLSEFTLVKMLNPDCLDSLLLVAVDALNEALKIQDDALMPLLTQHVFKQGQSVFLTSENGNELTSALAHLVFIRRRIHEIQDQSG